MAHIFLRDLKKTLCLVILFTFFSGTVFAWGGSWLADFYFGQTLHSILGDTGQYELLIAVRQGSQKAAEQQLKKIIAEKLPDVQWKEGVPLPGKIHYFLDFPDRYRQSSFWSKLDEYFGSMPGKIGYSVMIEPRITIRGLPRAVQEMIKELLMQEIPQIAFAFREGSSLVLVFKEETNLNEANKQVERILQRYKLFTVYFSNDYEERDLFALGEDLSKKLRQDFALSTIHYLNGSGGDLNQPSSSPALRQMQRFFLSYAVRIGIALEEKATVAPKEKVVLLLPDGQRTLQIEEIGDKWARAVCLQGQIANITGAAVYSSDGQRLLGLVTGVNDPRYQLQQGLQENIAFLEKLEILRHHALLVLDKSLLTIAEKKELQETERSLRKLQDLLRLKGVDKSLSSLNDLAEALPAIEEEELGAAIGFIEDYAKQQTALSQGMMFFTDKHLPDQAATKTVRRFLHDQQAQTISSPIGAVEVDLKGELRRLIASMRELLAALIAFVFLLFSLILDQSTVMSMLAILEDRKNCWWGIANLYGFCFGGGLLPLLVFCSGGHIPYLPLWSFIGLGGLIGYLLAVQTTIFSPIREQEVTAGESLGMNYQEIMVQIVIPASKPGFFKLLTRRKVKFTGRKKHAEDL